MISAVGMVRPSVTTPHGLALSAFTTTSASTAISTIMPAVTAISSLEIADGKGKAKRELEGAQEFVEFPLPAVLTVDEGLNTARLPSLKGIMPKASGAPGRIFTFQNFCLPPSDSKTSRV